MENVWDLTDTIVIIVSHSGGTFAPLACSNLMKAKTDKIFVVASGWDTRLVAAAQAEQRRRQV